jgi:hypothetical protein
MDILGEHIHANRFLRLIRQMLQAGDAGRMALACAR